MPNPLFVDAFGLWVAMPSTWRWRRFRDDLFVMCPEGFDIEQENPEQIEVSAALLRHELLAQESLNAFAQRLMARRVLRPPLKPEPAPRSGWMGPRYLWTDGIQTIQSDFIELSGVAVELVLSADRQTEWSPQRLASMISIERGHS
jgi:hypothetical protein